MALSAKERARLASAVLARVRGLDDVPDLDMDALQEMSTEDLFNYLEAHGAPVDRKQLAALTREQLGADLDALENGVEFKAAKQEKFEKDVQASVRNTARLVAKSTMRSMRQDALDVADERPDYERFSVWVSKLRRPCRDCEEFHGQIQSVAAWESIGVPGSGNTICGANCECTLVPVAVTREDGKARMDEINRQGPRRQALGA